LGLERSQVIFTHPIHYGLFCSSLLSLALVGFRKRLSGLKLYSLSALIFSGVVASVSSGALLPVFLQLTLIAWAWVFRSVTSRWVIFISIAIIGYIAVDAISNRTGIEVFLSYAALSPETAYGRILIFRWGMVNVFDNPILGIGLNDWVRPWWLHDSVDNFWLLATMRYGIPGFILLASTYVFLVWRVARLDFGSAGIVWQLRRAWVFTQVSLILTLATVDIWDAALSYVFFLLGAAAWMITWKSGPQVEDAESNFQTIRYTRFPSIRSRSCGNLEGREI
jgi:O-antigen ligase